MFCFDSPALMPVIHSAGMPLSLTSQTRSRFVRRDGNAFGVAPGLSLPITRSHPGKVCKSELFPRKTGSCCIGIQISGGSLRSVSPKNPGGVMPMTVIGCPSRIMVEPTIFGSDPYCCCHAR